MPAYSETELPFAVYLDRVLIETYLTEAHALIGARLQKRDLPDSLIMVWDLRNQTSRIVTE